MASEPQDAQGKTEVTEALAAAVGFKVTQSDKDDVKMLQAHLKQSESDVLRRYFDFDRMRDDAARMRAVVADALPSLHIA